MPTQDKTYAFASDAEGFSDAGLSAAITAAYDASQGDPSTGCLQVTTTTNNLAAVVEHVVKTTTWETEFPATAGKLVTNIGCPTFRKRRLADIQSSGTFSLRICDANQAGAVSVHGADIVTGTIAGGVAEAWQTDTSGTTRSVDSAYQASTTPIKIVWIVTLTTGDGTGGGS